jgi:hypothetical protein
MRTVRTHSDYFPLIWIEFDDQFTTEDLVGTLVDNEVILRKRSKFCTIRDGRRIRTMPNAVQRKIGAMWHDEMRAQLETYCLGVVTVTPPGIAHGLLTALNWVSTPPSPEAVEDTMQGAFEWASATLARAGLRVPLGAYEAILGPRSAPGRR